MIRWLAPLWITFPDWLHNFIIYNLNAKYVIGTNMIITNTDGQVWLQNHRFWPQYPWGLPGGHANANETPQQAIAREINEELSATVLIDSLLDIQQNKKRGLVVYFKGSFIQSPQTLDQTELIEAKFFDVNDLPAGVHPNHRKIIKKYLGT